MITLAHCDQYPTTPNYKHHPVAVEVLKVTPDLDARELSSWKSLELIDTLLALAEAGHSLAVKNLFQGLSL